ncbi:HipA-like N-terminal domain-containing protein [Duganella sp. CF402]|uniref:type II toxin-antitoxin system HipA family toxin n=1 Tax=unclassified Duganella TaxID=2636909 RepID=UPI0008BE63F1|nr:MULTISPECIES: HipA domain-containing protein [unclassified Duganella]RZT11404.1 HipA-like protein [Duganella sp. BK701]SEK66052.1 HipA-like N-terminal domain-containing protein [Duganella sp. CF402]
MKRVDVYYEGWAERWLLGTLAHGSGELLFEYSPQALEQKLELSPLKLPLQVAAFSKFPQSQHGLPGLIADSLPDGWGMLLMDRYCRKSGIEAAKVSPLDRLAFLGHRTMGALTFEPSQALPAPADNVDLLQLAQESQQVMSGKDSKLLAELVLMGGSPHGARPKVLVDYCAATGEMGAHGVANGQPWLVKFQSQGEHKEVCIIENCYAEMAQDCGLDIPATEYFDISPKLGGNVVFNNRDDHPKNFSFRLDSERHWKLSPAYDLTYSPGPGGYHQMDVMGEALAITRKDMLDLASKAGVPAEKARAHLDRHIDVASGFAKTLKAAKVRPSTVKDMAAQVEANVRRLR